MVGYHKYNWAATNVVWGAGSIPWRQPNNWSVVASLDREVVLMILIFIHSCFDMFFQPVHPVIDMAKLFRLPPCCPIAGMDQSHEMIVFLGCEAPLSYQEFTVWAATHSLLLAYLPRQQAGEQDIYKRSLEMVDEGWFND